MKPILNKWQFVAHFGRDWSSMERGWKRVELGAVKLHHLPTPGMRITKHLYQGFVLRFMVWLPIDVA